MLKFAYYHSAELLKAMDNLDPFDDRLKYFWACGYPVFDFQLDKNAWSWIEMVSIGEEGEVIGFFKANIDRNTRNVTSIAAINFSAKATYTFAIDFYSFMDHLRKQRFGSLSWKVCKGNPAEALYDEYIEKHGGSVVGITSDSVRLMDGSFCDEKLYEIVDTPPCPPVNGGE